MLKVGVTGGIGAGKTVVCRMFELLGIPVLNADNLAKSFYFRKEVKSKVEQLFGIKAYIDNQLNKKYISDCIFREPALRNALNALLHPLVKEESDQWFLAQDTHYAIKEAALMIESGSFKSLDKLIVVTAPLDIKINRIKKRDRLTKDEILKRIEAQLPDNERTAFADWVIVNDEKQLLIPQILHVHDEMMKM